MTTSPRLSIIVPVFNGLAHADALSTSLLAISDVTIELIFVDDGSTDGTVELLQRLAHDDPRVRPIYLTENAGAGAARNAGFSHARGEFTLFFDVDDHLHAAVIAPALEIMERQKADVAMFPYRYERSTDHGYDSMNIYDDRVWETYVGATRMIAGSLDDFPRLLGFTNYPWNKLLRTAHYRAAGLRFGRTKVNNDILGHWGTLLHARKIVLVNEVICSHIVHPSGGNLTNQHSRVRLELFDALHETYDLLQANDAQLHRYSHHFWSLSLRLIDWARRRVPTDLIPEFNAKQRELVARVSIADFGAMLMKRSPETAHALVRAMLS